MSKDALTVIEENKTAIARVDPEAFATAFDSYIQMQKVIDERMPKAIMTIQGKQFRKKAYWRAVATAFRLRVDALHDEYFETGDDWGYRITCIAILGERSAVGDGTCMASEKKRRDGSMVDATHHNVRGHAHTRAFNRAVSNLVGFGEVSAEEMPTGSAQNAPKSSQDAPQGDSGREWDGTVKFKSGQNAGKMWKEMNSGFIDWALTQDGALKEMAAKEAQRRVLADETVAKVVEGEVVDELNPPPPEEP